MTSHQNPLNLSQANLIRAKLEKTSFAHGNLSGADFRGAKLCEADL
ncbi:MAG: hypothetical protein BRC41_03555, partial [Cyanobacteria bacterium QH_9_48_43]